MKIEQERKNSIATDCHTLRNVPKIPGKIRICRQKYRKYVYSVYVPLALTIFAPNSFLFNYM